MAVDNVTLGRKEILIQGWANVYDHEGWYPPLKDALDGLSDIEARWKPSQASHSIRELVNHLIYYKDRLLHRLRAKEFTPVLEDNDETFEALSAYTDESWDEQLKRLEHIHSAIGKEISQLNDAALDTPMPAEPAGAQVFSLILHDAYHTGQIVLLRKLQGSWKK